MFFIAELLGSILLRLNMPKLFISLFYRFSVSTVKDDLGHNNKDSQER
jgi:hypothetical protein